MATKNHYRKTRKEKRKEEKKAVRLDRRTKEAIKRTTFLKKAILMFNQGKQKTHPKQKKFLSAGRDSVHSRYQRRTD